jgi:hypothetical protein
LCFYGRVAPCVIEKHDCVVGLKSIFIFVQYVISQGVSGVIGTDLAWCLVSFAAPWVCSIALGQG